MELAQWQQLLHEHFKELSLQRQSQPAKAPVRLEPSGNHLI